MAKRGEGRQSPEEARDQARAQEWVTAIAIEPRLQDADQQATQRVSSERPKRNPASGWWDVGEGISRDRAKEATGPHGKRNGD